MTKIQNSLFQHGREPANKLLFRFPRRRRVKYCRNRKQSFHHCRPRLQPLSIKSILELQKKTPRVKKKKFKSGKRRARMSFWVYPLPSIPKHSSRVNEDGKFPKSTKCSVRDRIVTRETSWEEICSNHDKQSSLKSRAIKSPYLKNGSRHLGHNRIVILRSFN